MKFHTRYGGTCPTGCHMKILSRVLAGLLVSFIVTCATAMVETFTALQDLSQVRAFLFC
jgi:hypothetical protein